MIKKTGRFKKGHKTWNKGRKTGLVPRSAFKKGKKHALWKGGRYLSKTGPRKIWFIYAPNHPYRVQGRYVQEHRLVMEKHIGRYLTRKEVVHHINGNSEDNRLDNLMLFPTSEAHLNYHRERKWRWNRKS